MVAMYSSQILIHNIYAPSVPSDLELVFLLSFVGNF